ncbi:hypothetical protein FS749_008440 [Ceratobasidium sp. UAMH 11750]|nr:hypothetical protein FS749_008440 [Ceratobasidium sp. UAMH 11750]
MCPPENNVKFEEVEDTLSRGLLSGINQGAKAENEVSEALADPKVINPGYGSVHELNPPGSDPFIYFRPVRAKAEDDDDVLTSLCTLFGEYIYETCCYILPPDLRL